MALRKAELSTVMRAVVGQDLLRQAGDDAAQPLRRQRDVLARNADAQQHDLIEEITEHYERFRRSATDQLNAERAPCGLTASEAVEDPAGDTHALMTSVPQRKRDTVQPQIRRHRTNACAKAALTGPIKKARIRITPSPA